MANFLARQPIVDADLARLRLLGLLLDPDVDLQAIERIVRMDVGLSFRVLRAAGHGAAHGMHREVRSVMEAVVILGPAQLRRWVMLMLVADFENTVPEQLTLTMVRARMGELVAGLIPGLDGDVGFTVGLLSALDLLLDAPIADAIETLPLEAETRAALVDGTGRLGQLIACIRGFEVGTPPAGSVLGVDHGDLVRSYKDSVTWSITNGSSITPPTAAAMTAPAPKAPVKGWTEVTRSPLQAGV